MNNVRERCRPSARWRIPCNLCQPSISAVLQLRIQPTADCVIPMGKNLHINGPVKFKLVLFKGLTIHFCSIFFYSFLAKYQCMCIFFDPASPIPFFLTLFFKFVCSISSFLKICLLNFFMPPIAFSAASNLQFSFC